MSANDDLAAMFRTMAALMDLKGENPFKAISFQKVSRMLRDRVFDARQAVEQGTLGKVEGVGEHSRRIIEEFVRTGRSTDYEVLVQSVPAGLLPLLQVEGLGPKTIGLFWKERNITSVADLTRALADGSLLDLRGIGEKKLDAIRKGLEALARGQERTGIADALPVAEDLLQRVRSLPQVVIAEVAGSLRRRRETIGDIDIVGAVKKPEDGEAVTSAFAKFPIVSRVLGKGPTKASIKTVGGMQADLRIVPAEHFGAALLYFTGSKEHNIKIRGLALKKKMTLNEWGLYRQEDYERADKPPGEAPSAKPVAASTEAEIYRRLGLPLIPPELREDRGEIEAALAGKLPQLIERGDIRGDLHAHTTASDGTASIEQMAEAAKALGYKYIAITDHSQSQVIANGLSPERLLGHIKDIRRAGDRVKGVTILAGAEVDILADGRLDYEDAVLAELDLVIASPHFALKQDPRKATDRLLRAIEHRHVHIIGHPTGRLIGGREGLSPDFAALFKAAAASGTAMEINASYPRLDLDEFNARAAAAAGVKLAINTDAHSPADYDLIGYGLGVARRAWLGSGDVVNCMSLRELRQFLHRKR